VQIILTRQLACLKQRLLNQFLYRSKISALLGSAEGNGGAPGPRSASPSYAMHVGLSIGRQIIIDDVGNIMDIQSARRNVRRHKHGFRA